METKPAKKEYTNVTTHLINLHDSSPMIPGQTLELSDDVTENPRFQEMLEAGEIVAGKPQSSEGQPEGETDQPVSEQPPARQAAPTPSQPVAQSTTSAPKPATTTSNTKA